MRRSVVLVALAISVVAASAANAQSKKDGQSIEQLNDNSFRMMRDIMPLFMPSAVSMAMLANKQMENQTAQPQKRMKKR